jgi:hypothetical protein
VQRGPGFARATAIVAFATLMLAYGASAIAQTTAPAAVENPAITTLARAQLDAFRSGKIDRSQYTAVVNAHLTDADVSDIFHVLGGAGEVKTFAYAGTAIENGIRVWQYTVAFEHPISVPMMPTTANWVESIATDKDGKVTYFSLSPKT